MGEDWKFSVDVKDSKAKELSLEKKRVMPKPTKLKLDFESKPCLKSRSTYGQDEKVKDENVILSNIKYYGKKFAIVLSLVAIISALAKYFNLL